MASILHTILPCDVVLITNRDIYYRDPELFVKQAVVDRYVDDIAFSIGVPRQALNISATAKGIFRGKLKVCESGSRVDYSTGSEVRLGY